ISRFGSTSADLTVSYFIGGTASNGVDYAAITDSVVIHAGALSASVLIKPIDDTIVEGAETVTPTLRQPDCLGTNPPPGCYQVGYPSNALVFIEDNDRITNARPTVHITSPTNNSAFVAPVDIPITAVAADVDDDVVRVDFFANDHFLGSDIGT